MKSWAAVLVVVMAVGVMGAASGPGLTLISDNVYRADGSAAQGTLTITWPEFTTSNGAAVAAGSMTVTLGAGGALNVALAPNAGAVPAGTFYKVVAKDTTGVTATEFWVVPAVAQTTLSVVRTEMLPANVAAQAATKSYVDSVVVHNTGNESVAGVKSFTATPTAPDPQNGIDLANKEYVDGAAGLNPRVVNAAQTNQSNLFSQQQSMSDLVLGSGSPSVIDVRWFGVKGDGKYITDATMTAGSAALTSGMGRFVCPTDIGRTVWVQGAGVSGATLATTIANCTDSNHVTLARTAGTSIAALSISDAAMTSGSGVLSSASGKFTSAMVGYAIYVPGAGASGGVLQTSVAGYTDANHLTLAANASSTVAGQTVSFLFHAVIGTDDTAALQSAINSAATQCNAGGGTWNLCPTLLFPARNFVISASLNYKSVPWLGMGPLKTALLWVGPTGGTMVYVPSGNAGGASWGGIKGMQLRMGTNWPKTHIEFDAAVDAGWFLEEDSFLGASGNSIEITQGFVNLHWQKLRWDSVAGYMVRFASAAPCYVASSAVIDKFTADLSPVGNPQPPTNPLGYFLIDNTPANCGVPRTKYRFNDARIENNTVPFASTGAVVGLVNTTATGNNGLPVDVTMENITGQNPALSTVGTNAPMGLYCNVPTDCDTAIVHVRDFHTTGWASGFVVQPPSADFGYGWWPRCAGNCDISVLDMNATSGPRIWAGNTLINDFVTLQSNGKVFQARDFNHAAAGSTNYPEFDLDVSGKMQWYPGNSGTADVNLYRGSAGVLKSDQEISAAAVIGGLNTVTFSATPTFDVSKGNTQLITLTGNVTSSLLVGALAGERLLFIVCQDATGARTFVWPASVKGGGVIGSTASKCSVQDFVWDGASARAVQTN
ncbi:MAG TPA: hypothetical protein VGL89_02355 [Candidatus Koribacter sp.]|jgi:hypothetical protein